MSRLNLKIDSHNFSQLLLMVVICFCSHSCFAQYKSPTSIAEEKEAESLLLLEKEVEKIIGKTFWIKPNPKATQHIKFYEYPNLGGVPEFFVTAENNFKIIELNGSHVKNKFLMIEFADGKTGYIYINPFMADRSGKYSIIPNLIDENQSMSDYEEYIFSIPPEQFIAAYKAKQSKDIKSAKNKSGVKIGMTSSAVLKSSWGKPLAVNRTTTASGVREQWVYGGGNYLYFDGGILSGIQN